MAFVSRRNTAATSLELRSAVMTLTALVLTEPGIEALARELDAQAETAPDLFDQDPVLIDLSRLRELDTVPDLAALLALLRRHRLLPLAVRGGSPAQMAAARALGLAEAPAEAPPVARPPLAVDAPVVPEPDAVPVPDRRINPATPTLVIDRPLRSGQQVYARGADLVVLALVSHGAEVIADGSIHVYAPLRGRAIAGAKGLTSARIFSTCMEPQLISIAGTYRTFESPLPAEVLGRAAQVRLDGERLVVEPLEDNTAPAAERAAGASHGWRSAGAARS